LCLCLLFAVFVLSRHVFDSTEPFSNKGLLLFCLCLCGISGSILMVSILHRTLGFFVSSCRRLTGAVLLLVPAVFPSVVDCTLHSIKWHGCRVASDLQLVIVPSKIIINGQMAASSNLKLILKKRFDWRHSAWNTCSAPHCPVEHVIAIADLKQTKHKEGECQCIFEDHSFGCWVFLKVICCLLDVFASKI